MDINQGEAYNRDSYPHVGGDAGDGPSATIPRIVIRVSLNLPEVQLAREEGKLNIATQLHNSELGRHGHYTQPFPFLNHHAIMKS